MREILFRGKRKDNGEWLQGDLRHWNSGEVGIHSDILHRTIKVNPETVGQFTGLVDKAGKRIFEGDILRGEWFPDQNIPEQYTFVVKWHKTGWAVEEKPYPAEFLLDEKSLDGCEVIGNIHDRQDSCEEIVLGSYDSEGNLEQSFRISADCLTLENVSGEKLSIYQGNALEDLAEMLGRR